MCNKWINTRLVLCLYGIMMASVIQAAPITFNTALPVSKGEYLVREQLILNQSGNDPSTTNRKRTETVAATAVGYGVNHKWTIFGVLPYHDIELNLDSGGQRVNRSNSGTGDLILFTRYNAYQENQRGKTFRVAPFLGLKAPTGSDNKSDAKGILPVSVQVASGSWDYFGGVVLTWQTLKYQVDMQASYRVNNEANGFRVGNVTRLDGSLQYRLWRSNEKDVIPDYLYGVIETNFISQGKNQINGADDQNSNGTRLFISPGIQYVTKRWIAEVAVQLPISQNLNGIALQNNYIMRTSFRFNF